MPKLCSRHLPTFFCVLSSHSIPFQRDGKWLSTAIVLLRPIRDDQSPDIAIVKVFESYYFLISSRNGFSDTWREESGVLAAWSLRTFSFESGTLSTTHLVNYSSSVVSWTYSCKGFCALRLVINCNDYCLSSAAHGYLHEVPHVPSPL